MPLRPLYGMHNRAVFAARKDARPTKRGHFFAAVSYPTDGRHLSALLSLRSVGMSSLSFLVSIRQRVDGTMKDLSDGTLSAEIAGRIGADVLSDGTRFRVWAPKHKSVEVVFETGNRYPLKGQRHGYFVALVNGAMPGDRYKFLVDGEGPFPDPASRFQPDGPHGWSQIIDHGAYSWDPEEDLRPGVQLIGQVIYELHIGTFTSEGTYKAVERELQRLRDLGITILEIMPLAEFSGDFGWGYDGVDLFAPYHRYGTPDDLRHMIEAAHRVGLNVILDVVYNHFGPDGTYLPRYSPYYFSTRATEWGDAINFDGRGSVPVREFFIHNAEQWIRGYHFDGLRFDATQSIQDSGTHGRQIIAAIACAARTAAGRRSIVLISECERQLREQIISPPSGYGLDAMWNDDLHHSAIVRLTGKREAYYTDHLGRAQEFISAAKYGFLFQGQYYSWQKAPRGTPFLHIEPWHLVSFLENHDQVANTLAGTHPRTNASPRKYRTMASYWLLTSGTPMFFMGQEYGSTRPFLYFSDQPGELRELVRKGRVDFLTQFESVRNIPNVQALIPDPSDESTFTACKLDPSERDRPEGIQLQRFFADLLRIRREDPAISTQRRGAVDGAVLTDDCLVLRFFAYHAEYGHIDRLLLVNFGPLLQLAHLPEPLLAPPAGMQWRCIWDSEQPEYGGSSAVYPITRKGWHVSEECAILLAAHPRPPHKS